MQRYLFSRLIQSILLMIGVLILVFFIVRLTGDPARLMMPRDASPQEVEVFREAMGFNEPLHRQFSSYMRGAMVGDFGRSLHYRSQAMPLVIARLPATLELALAALAFALLIAIPLGIIGGSRPGSIWDTLCRAIGLVGQTVPNFWLALMLIVYFSVQLQWFPTFGRSGFRSLVLPAIALGFFPLGKFTRLVRSAVLEVRSEDYIRTAYSKGLLERNILFRHIFRNVAITLVSIVGVQFGYMLGGSIYIESIFAWPGIGRMINEAVQARDFPLVQAIAVFSAGFVVLLNLLTDVAYALIDPRIRYED
ncbi:peptide/nickel transport system permease protein [Alkalispirochaeta americana]|uniref:Peptide/nickel transport system permease protein n=1 Tax=Alkalispirochaeta americana TaxID=159291 RepID=A0A1N6NA82_9SPIO|nr:ABC transporter permease [Alkalispirochaeta americana]SIP88937.1 peptide/nickel transport system permease protein [Alkalispirochaeta americana]